jgi:hypothetical protein
MMEVKKGQPILPGLEEVQTNQAEESEKQDILPTDVAGAAININENGEHIKIKRASTTGKHRFQQTAIVPRSLRKREPAERKDTGS